MIINPFPHFAAFRYTPTIPAIYWNVESPEQALKQLAMHYDKIVAWIDAMVDTVNNQYEIVEDLQTRLPQLVLQDVTDYLNQNLADETSVLYQLINQAVTDWANARTAQVDALQDWVDSVAPGDTYDDLRENGFLYIPED